MSIGRALGFNSAVYVVTTLLQRGAMFLLLPLYTRLLSPEDYGILAVITALSGFLSIIFTFALHGAVTRFYFEYKDQPERLREFWGTILTFVGLSSAVGATLLLVFSHWLLEPFVGDVPINPFVIVGVVTVVFQPYVMSFLNILQTRGEAMRYARFALANSLTTIVVTIGLVVLAGWGAMAPLVAALLSSMIFCGVALWVLRNDIRFGINWADLRQALHYCLPQIPHSLGSQVVATIDRLLLNRIAGVAAAGLYNVGAMFGMMIDIVGYSVNRAYVPLAMDTFKQGTAEGLGKLRDLGLIIISVFMLGGAAIGMFADELVRLMTGPAFHAGASVVPFIALGGAAGGIYHVLVSILFYNVRATRYLPLGMLCSATVSVTANLLLIPEYGFVGAGWAALLAQVTTTVVIASIGSRFDPIRWPYLRLCGAFASALFVTALALQVEANRLVSVPVRLVLLAVLAAGTGLWLWGRPGHLFNVAYELGWRSWNRV